VIPISNQDGHQTKNEVISIFINGSHLGYRTALMDTIRKGTTQESFRQSLVEIGSVV
jgi:hypothetical protein